MLIGIQVIFLMTKGHLEFPGAKFHYVFFDSQRDPANDPIILWLNGGPGCSSMISMVYENGPFKFDHNTTELNVNDYSWNKKANLLYIESPGGVGYSTSTSSYHDDHSVANDNLNAVLEFFKKFPNLKSNDFYISGESYAGIYVPWLAWKIIQHNALPTSKENTIKLKGVLVGNACTDPLECAAAGKEGTSIYQYEFLYEHSYYTERQYNNFKAVCLMGYNSTECIEIRKVLDDVFAKTRTSILNIYNPCYGLSPDEIMAKSSEGMGRKKRRMKQSGRYHASNSELDCDDNIGIMDFFNKHGNFDRLHVDGSVKFEECNDELFKNYVTFENGSIWIYPELMKNDIRIWIYSGDVDADVPITGTLAWLQRFR